MNVLQGYAHDAFITCRVLPENSAHVCRRHFTAKGFPWTDLYSES